ncbi:Uncharacterised protein [Vibrio cholerae]|nr:Uncharacterised protein [Vibrio cholerae]
MKYVKRVAALAKSVLLFAKVMMSQKFLCLVRIKRI